MANQPNKRISNFPVKGQNKRDLNKLHGGTFVFTRELTVSEL